MIGKLNIHKTILYFITLFIYFIFLFGRSFTGIMIFGFRLGELMIGFLLLLSLILFFTNIPLLKANKEVYTIYKIFYLLILTFLLTSLLTDTNLLDLYTFKVSTYIWVIPCLFLGVYYSESFVKDKKIALFIGTALPIVYVLSTVKFPNVLMNFFIKYSDKFDFVKASDLLLVYVFVNMILRINFKDKFISFSYFIISSSIMFPMFLFKSKGSFAGCLLFFALEIYNHKNFIKDNILKTIVVFGLTPIFFVISSFEISGDSLLNGLFIEPVEVSQDLITEANVDTEQEKAVQEEPTEIESGVISETLLDNFDNKVAGNGTSLSGKMFEIVDGRIYSSDNTLNWRFQIWQDVIYDLIDENQIFYGYGYKDIIPAMNTIARSGVDNKNENVHNFFINIIARGGLFHLMIYLSIFFLLIFKNQDRNIVIFIIPLIIVSMFDSSMESVRFPATFYFVLGCFLYLKNKQKSDIIE